jgi:hypothetical protein
VDASITSALAALTGAAVGGLYLEPDKSFVELRGMTVDGKIDLLQGFSDACHAEFDDMRARQFQASPRVALLSSLIRMPRSLALTASHRMHWPKTGSSPPNSRTPA